MNTAIFLKCVWQFFNVMYERINNFSLLFSYYRLFEPAMPLRIYQAARSLFIAMKEGKRHTSVSKESEIQKLPQEYFAGSLLIDFKEVQGGHTAYILSALVNSKVLIEYLFWDHPFSTLAKCSIN